MPVPSVRDNISEQSTVMKVRHPGRYDLYGKKAARGQRFPFQVRGRVPLRRWPRKTAR